MGGHIVGLDFWRALLMLGGVVLHGSIGLPPNSLFSAVDIVSQTFRMGSFFGIAGVLSAVILARRDPSVWLRQRLIQLGVPLLVCMIVIAPLIWLMKTRFATGEVSTPLVNWYHLWFLAGLIAYSLVTYAVIRSRLDVRLAARIDRMIDEKLFRPSTALLVTSVVSASLFGVSPRLMAASMSAKSVLTFSSLQLIAGYLPMFFLGYLVGRLPKFANAMLEQTQWATAILIVVVVTFITWFAAVAPRLELEALELGTSRLRFLAAAICPPAAFILILKSAYRITHISALVKRISLASYTIYLLHLPIALAINTMLSHVGTETYLSFGVAVLGSAVTSFYIHEKAVRRWSFLSLLLNGKPIYQAAPSVEKRQPA